jgi:hypothetical protein
LRAIFKPPHGGQWLVVSGQKNPPRTIFDGNFRNEVIARIVLFVEILIVINRQVGFSNIATSEYANFPKKVSPKNTSVR